MNDLATAQDNAALLERVVVGGDLSKLSPHDRMNYYAQVCQSVGLNPLTRPFEYIQLNGKLTLYAKRDATDQLRAIHGVSVEDMVESEREGVYIVTVKAKNKDGRTDMAKGAVTIANLKGDALANAMMKAETKAKRRVTLSLCGLGLLDETEIETIPNARVGEPVSPAPAEPEPMPLAESVIVDHIAKMEEAVELIDLQKAFANAITAAAEARDMKARDRFVAAKDKRKAELSPKAA